jgi:hypothetical protein
MILKSLQARIKFSHEYNNLVCIRPSRKDKLQQNIHIKTMTITEINGVNNCYIWAILEVTGKTKYAHLKRNMSNYH